MSRCKFETSNGRCGLRGCYAYRHKCFTEGMCRCHEPQTKADRIRSMSDEELARLLYCSDGLGWCRDLPECVALLNTDEGVPEEKCMSCLVTWLQQPAEEVQ